MLVFGNPKIIAGLACAACTAAVAAHIVHHQPLIYLFKPLAAILLLALAIDGWARAKQAYALCICIGLFFSFIGDVLLMQPDKFFLPGLAAFLLTHIAYLIAFIGPAKLLSRPLVFLYFLPALIAYALLAPKLPADLKLPVAIYSLLLSSMAAQGMIRFRILKTAGAKLAAIGAIFFMLSDFLLAFDRFYTALPLASVLILAPYYLAQLLIALSTRPASR
jgi:uncharacterized membrane protein YhhN